MFFIVYPPAPAPFIYNFVLQGYRYTNTLPVPILHQGWAMAKEYRLGPRCFNINSGNINRGLAPQHRSHSIDPVTTSQISFISKLLIYHFQQIQFFIAGIFPKHGTGKLMFFYVPAFFFYRLFIIISDEYSFVGIK